jgi:hypothetical protein
MIADVRDLLTARGAIIHAGPGLNTHEGVKILEDNDPILNPDTAVLAVSKRG